MKLDVKLEIEPYQGIAGVKFGMSRGQVRHALNSSVQAFKKLPTDELDTDAFDDLGMHVYYKNPDVCEAIELFTPANPTIQGQVLMGKPFGEMREWFLSVDPQIEIDDTGLTSFQLGIGLYVPFASQILEDFVAGVIVFERGYYDI